MATNPMFYTKNNNVPIPNLNPTPGWQDYFNTLHGVWSWALWQMSQHNWRALGVHKLWPSIPAKYLHPCVHYHHFHGYLKDQHMSLNGSSFKLFAAATLIHCLYISFYAYTMHTVFHVIYFQPRRPPQRVRKQGGKSICQINKIPNSYFSLHVAQAFATSCHMGRASLLRNFCQISRSCLRNSQVAWWVTVLVYGLCRLYMYDSWLKLALVRRWGCGGVWYTYM
jgi:hypothetical protein